MLALTRKPGEKVVIGGDITVMVVETRGNRVRLAFDAPDQVCILRGELFDRQDLSSSCDGLQDPDLEEKPAEWKTTAVPSVVAAADAVPVFCI
jgi:carbon storage regulator